MNVKAQRLYILYKMLKKKKKKKKFELIITNTIVIHWEATPDIQFEKIRV